MDNKRFLAFVLLFVGLVFVTLGGTVNKTFLYISPIFFLAAIIGFSSGLAKKEK